MLVVVGNHELAERDLNAREYAVLPLQVPARQAGPTERINARLRISDQRPIPAQFRYSARPACDILSLVRHETRAGHFCSVSPPSSPLTSYPARAT